jgi:predicted ArsR family transcriptional regulator
VRTVQMAVYDGEPHAGAARDRGAQGARRGHAVPPVPIPPALGAAGRRPRAGDPLSAAPEHPAPHLRRLEEVGSVARETRRTATSRRRPQTLYVAVDVEPREGRDHKLLADILSGLLTTSSSGTTPRSSRASGARTWWPHRHEAGCERPSGPNLAALQDGLGRAGFTPRFRRTGKQTGGDHLARLSVPRSVGRASRLVCAVHRGPARGMLAASRPA